MKLANEVEAVFGRPTLDKIMKECIPDEDYEPSTLHYELLELPWSDLFTTNYDTLLERTSKLVINQKYSLVNKQQDLINTKRPRIIKLHGSFTSGDIIVTEEDYRTYPKKFAPFVQTVRQSLLENTLCLIGFSGDDPNFKEWIGWIKDNLGKENSLKIYLIGLLNLSYAEKKLLGDRNITLVDLSSCDGVNGNHQEALNLFLKFLQSKMKQDHNLNWPQSRTPYFGNYNEESIEVIVANWEEERLKFPNWLILSENQREILWTHTTRIINHIENIKNTNSYLEVLFWYELNWRLEKCLYPIFDNLVPLIENVIRQFGFLENKFALINDNAITGILSINENNDIKGKWLDLQLALLRYYREENFQDKWLTSKKVLELSSSHLSPEQLARFYYEQSLQALFNVHISQLQKILKDWPDNNLLPYWECKRTGLLVEVGKVEEAEKILDNSLTFIRSHLNIPSETNDYTWISQESYLIFLSKIVKSRINNTVNKVERNNFQERESYLTQFKSDPYNEFKLFRIKLEFVQDSKSLITKRASFDINRISSTYRISANDKDTLTGYSFLRFVEEIGMPLKISGITIEKNIIEGAVKRISFHSPHWALVTIFRLGNTQTIGTILTRQFILQKDSQEVESLINHYIEAFDKLQIENLENITYIIPEILSHFSVKCSDISKLKLLNFLKTLYLSEKKQNFRGVSHLLIRLLESSSIELKSKMFIPLLEFPLLNDSDLGVEPEFLEPFDILFLNKKRFMLYNIRVSKEVVDHLISVAKEPGFKRRRSISRLATLNHLNILNKNQQIAFGKALWSQLDSDSGFPSGFGFHNFKTILNLPHPNRFNFSSIFKNYLLSSPFPIQNLEINKGKGLSITNGNIPYFKNLLKGIQPNLILNIEWTNDEILSFFDKLLDWWNHDKIYLRGDDKTFFISVSDEFFARFKYINLIVYTFILYYQDIFDSSDNKTKLINLITELNENNVPHLQAKAAFVAIFSVDINEIIIDIENAFASKSYNKVIDAAWAIIKIINLYEQNYYSELDIERLLHLLSQQVKWRIPETLPIALDTLSNIVERNSELINNVMLSDILSGLQYLLKETNLVSLSSETDLEKILIYRKYSARLASMLNQFYNNFNLTTPQVIKDWKIACNSINEFDEIKKEWEN